MLKRLALAGICLSTFVLLAVPAQAQVSATLILRNGDRVSGDLLDHGGVGFTIRVSGQDRRIAEAEVAAVEFTGAQANDDVRNRLAAGKQLIVLRSGEIIEGRLYDIGGTSPLNLTFDTSSGRRQFTSGDVAQFYYAAPPNMAVATSGSTAAPATALAPGAVRVDANVQWNNTGITVRRGDRVTFTTTGRINYGQGADMTASPDGNDAMRGNQYPVAGMPVGGLIGKVGNSAPFPIGSNAQPVTMPANGTLMLGVNDTEFGDNSGFFSVVVTKGR